MGCSETKPIQKPNNIPTADTCATTGDESHNANISNYKFIKEIGNGGIAKTFLCKDQDNAYYAIQKIPKSNLGLEACAVFTSHFQQLQAIDHPYIVKFNRLLEDPLNLYIVMQYCTGVTLYDKLHALNKFNEKESSKIIYMLLSAVAYLGTIGIVHCDIKASNILYSEIGPMIKIIDFNLCKFKKEGYDEHVDGSPQFISPERLNSKFSTAADMWAIGVTMYILLSGEYPFWGKDIDELYKKIKAGKLSWDGDWSYVSEDAKDLLRKLLNPNYKRRITAKDALEHKWFATAKKREDVNLNEIFESLIKVAPISVWKSVYDNIRLDICDNGTNDAELVYYFLKYLKHYNKAEEIITALNLCRAHTESMGLFFGKISQIEHLAEAQL